MIDFYNEGLVIFDYALFALLMFVGIAVVAIFSRD